MFSLHAAAKFFDNDPLYDAYSGDYLYKGQFATYDGSQLDGSFVRRRTVSLAPDLDLPARRVVRLYEEYWVLSDPITDGFLGTPIRKTMSARKAHELYTIADATEAIYGGSLWQAHAHSRWTKGTAQAATSELQPYNEFSFALSEDNLSGMFIVGQKGLWHVRMATEVAEGFQLAEADFLAESGSPRVDVTLPGTIDPETLETTGAVTAKALLLERYSFYRQLDQAQPLNHAGDKTLVMATADVTPSVVSVLIAGNTWNVMGRQPIKGGVALHVRRV